MARKSQDSIERFNEYQKGFMRRYRQENPKPAILAKVKARAKKAGIPFDLTVDDLEIPEVCPVLGIPLEFNRTGRNGPAANSPSLDRKDPALGYVKGNVAFISHKVNAAKSDLTVEQLESLLRYMKKEYGGD